MRYGKFLPEKGTIGFVAPSFGCNIEPYRSAFINAQKIWEQQGYGFSFGLNAYEGCGIESVTLRKSVQKNLMTGMLRKM